MYDMICRKASESSQQLQLRLTLEVFRLLLVDEEDVTLTGGDVEILFETTSTIDAEQVI